MSLLCSLRQQRIARRIVQDAEEGMEPALTAHIARCPNCCVFASGLQRLHNSLPEALPPVTSASSSEDFAEAVWTRLQRTPIPQRRSLPTPLLASALGVMALFGLLYWQNLPVKQPLSETSTPQVVTTRRSSGTKSLVRLPQQKIVLVKNVRTDTKTQLQSPVMIKTKAHRSVRRHHPHKTVQMAHQTEKRGPIQTVMLPQRHKPLTADQWTQWAAWYEAQGDYSRASLAYSRAYAQRPEPGLAYAAGRTAESAGNVVQAMQFYARSLETKSTTEKPPEKGTFLWDDTHISF